MNNKDIVIVSLIIIIIALSLFSYTESRNIIAKADKIAQMQQRYSDKSFANMKKINDLREDKANLIKVLQQYRTNTVDAIHINRVIKNLNEPYKENINDYDMP